MAGAPKGNRNGAHDKPWTRALERVAAQDREAMRRIALKVMEMAEAGDIAAIKELGDRLDGKPKQSVEATGSGGGPVRFIIEQ